jgi:hypothetical protein
LCQIVFKYSPTFQPWEVLETSPSSGVPTVETVGYVPIHIVCIFFKYSPRFQPWEALETYRHHLASQRLKPLAMFQFILFVFFLNITVETVGYVPIHIVCIFFKYSPRFQPWEAYQCRRLKTAGYVSMPFI